MDKKINEFLRLKVDIIKGDELLFLIDRGADISLLKGNKLLGTTEYDPERKVKVKCVDGSPMETHGVLEARIELSSTSILHDFQLVNKQVDIPCDGILGRDSLQRTRAKVCYETRTVALNGETRKMVVKAKQLEARETNMRKTGKIKLPTWTENIVTVPETPGSPLVGMINECKIQEGIIIAASLTNMVDDYVMTGIRNTNDTQVWIQEPLVELEVDPARDRSRSTEFESHDRERF